MADNVEIQGLEFQIVNDSTQAVAGLQNLINTLNRLKTACSGSATSLDTTAKAIRGLSNALKGLNAGDTAQKITRIATAMQSLKNLSGVKISSSLANQITAIGTAVKGIQFTDGDKLTALANGLRPLSELGKANMTTFINQLGKLPKVIEDLDKADISKFTQEMTALAAAMKPFADEMQKVSNGFSAFPSKIQKVITSSEKYNSAMSGATARTNTFSTALKGLKFVSLAVIFRKVSQFLGSAINRASEYLEDMNLFTVSMGEYAEEAYKYAQQVSEVMGIDPAEWMRNQGVFNTIITGFGVASDKAALMSKNLTQLGYDISSFYNISFAESMQKVQSGIAGELEPLRRIGYDLSVARLQQEAYNLGITKSVSAMTQAEKAQLRYYTMMTQVTQVQGDMARTLEQPTNMIRVLKAQLEQAARAIGDLFIPALTKILPIVIAVAKALREIIAAVAALFGVELQTPDWSNAFEGASVGSGEIADNMDDAAGAAKKLKQYVAGFDELNVFSPSDSSGSGSGIGLGGDLGIDLPEYDFLKGAATDQIDEWQKKLRPFVDWIKEHLEDILKITMAIGAAFLAWKIGTSVMASVTSLKTVLAAIAGSKAGQAILSKLAGTLAAIALQFNVAGGGVKGFLSVLGLIAKTAAPALAILTVIISTLRVLVKRWDEIKTAVGNALAKLGVSERLKTLNEKLDQLGVKLGWVNGFWEGLKSTISALMDFIGEVVITVIGGTLIGIFNGLVSVLDGVITAVTGVVDIFRSLGQFFKGVFTGDIELVKKSFETLATGIAEVFSGVFSGIVNGLAGLISGVITGISELGTTLLGDLIPNIVTGITTFFSTLCTNISLFFSNAWTEICTLWVMAGEWFSVNVITPVSTFFSNLGTNISNYFSASWTKIKTQWAAVTAWFQTTVITPTQTTFDAMCTAVGGFFTALWEKITGVFAGAGAWFQTNVVDAITFGFRYLVNGAIGLIEGMLNGIVQALNWVISKVNSVLSVFGRNGIEYLSEVKIDRLADGGFVDEGQLFIAREAGAEMVGAMGRKTAVANNDQIVEGISAGVSIANDGVIAAIHALLNAVEEKDLSVNIGDNQIGESYDRYNRSRGVRVNTGAFSNAY